MYFLIDEIVVSPTPGHLQGSFLVFYYCPVGENHNLGAPPTEGNILGKNPVYPYISNVSVQASPEVFRGS